METTYVLTAHLLIGNQVGTIWYTGSKIIPQVVKSMCVPPENATTGAESN